MARNKTYIPDNSPAEEAEIQAQIRADPDTWEAPAGAPVLRRGRPPGATKLQVTVRIDKDLIAALKKPEPKGWQTRLNAALKKGMSG